ncbi:cytochrome P450 [Pleomassaria siparia CBS 279.74]|uniref:Cytochrome P450 n=1 Tax=Pleomassaria siparia CBS 279.74 TaxID=1314801 RepID=A0A6G1KPZ9_9PLEO|nr:cytochrome P450 [Pleomassaria siparia CBS 279.74]
MSLPILIPLFAALVIFLLYRFILTSVFLSPLSRIPAAHPTCALSSLWIKYHRRNGSQALPVIINGHETHGPIIRLSPNEVSVSSLEGAKKVYIEKGGFAKPKWFADEFASYGVTNMVSMTGGIGSKEHALRKRDLGNVYSKSVLLICDELRNVTASALKDMEEILQAVVVGDKGGVIEVFSFNGAVNADIASAYIYGRNGGTHFLRDVKARDEYFEHQRIWMKGMAGRVTSQQFLEDFGSRRCSAVEAGIGDEEKGNSKAIVYNQLFSRGLRGNDVASETLDHFIAGAVAPQLTLTYLEWELSRNKEIQTRLRAELRSLSPGPQAESKAVDIPDFKTLDALPYLDAVLTETLRLYTAAPGAMYRITPPEGTTIHGHFIPGGTTISASFSILHQNAAVFPDPLAWKPERWLTEDKEELERMRNWFWAFMKGSRICIGKDFTLLVMKLIVSKMYEKYETEVVDDDGIEQEDAFFAGPLGQKLVLKFRVVGF